MREEQIDRIARRLAERLDRRVVAGGAVGWALRARAGVSAAEIEADAVRKKCKTVSSGKVKKYIKKAAKEYNQPYKKMLCVAQCESGLNNCAVNKGGKTYGLFQFKTDTWKSTKYSGKDLWDPKWNALATAWMWSQGRENEWDCCCPKFKCNCPGKTPSWC